MIRAPGVYFKWLYCILLLWVGIPDVAHAQTDSLLLQLNEAIRNQRFYVQQKQEQIAAFIENLKQGVPEGEKFDTYSALWSEYSSFQFDSAFKYAERMLHTAMRMKEESSLAEAKLNLAFVFRSAGMYKEAFDTLQTIRSASLPNELGIRYYESMARAYFDLSSFNGVDFFVERYGKLGNIYIDSAIQLCDHQTLQYYRLSGLRAEANQNYREALFLFHQIIEQYEVSQHQYAMAYYSLGKINQALGHEEEYLHMIIRSATADIKSATKETVASMELAGYMYEHGNIEDASLYINQAARDAGYYGAKQRIIQVSSLLPLIESAKLINAQYRSKKLLAFLVLVSILALLVIAFAVIILRQYRKLNATKRNLSLAYDTLRELNEKLLEANTIKEEYVGFSFAKDSEYLQKLEKFKKDIHKKLIEKRYDDVRYTLRQFDLEEETQRLNRQFDEIFLRLFPNFVAYFNSFFQKEDQFVLDEKSALPTELRIFALIRIGITEHEQIASILGYSVRTIYNYKNKVKSLSILSNEAFEAKLMEIKTFE